MAANIPCVSPFDSEVDDTAVGQKWDKWLLRFHNYLAAIDVDGSPRSRALLLHAIGPRTFEMFQSLPNTGDSYDEAKQALTTYFKPKVSVEYEKAVFKSIKQKAGEKLDAYHTRCRLAAATCAFADTDAEIKSHIIQTTNDVKVRKMGLKNDALTLKDLLDTGRSNELAQVQSQEMEKDLPSQVAHQVYKQKRQQKSQPWKNSRSQQMPSTSSQGQGRGQQHKPSASSCWKCGKAFPHVGGVTACPAYDKQCHKCQRHGHFEKYCGQQRPKPRQYQSRARRVHEVQEHSESQLQEQDNNEYVFSVDQNDECVQYNVVCNEKSDHVFVVKQNDVDHVHMAVKGMSEAPKFKIKFDKSTTITMTADSAASCNLIDEETYSRYLKHKKLEKRNTNIKAYGGARIHTIGYFTSTVECGDNQIQDVFFVVSGQHGCLLSVKASTTLGLIKVADHVCNSVEADKYPTVFKGIGKLKDVEINIHIDESVPPVAQRHRRIPFQQRKMVEQEIDNLLENDIIERAEGPTPWVSPIVVVPKPKRPGEVRLCVDMREANCAILRERHPSPTIDDIVERLNGAKVFSKVDLKAGYHQLMLSESCRYITTFSTHTGLYRYKRLNFGICSASEVFQRVVEDVIGGIDGAFNISDDIFIFGKGDDPCGAHDKALDEVLCRLKESGLTANLPKCEFRKPSMEFYGMIFSESGLAPDVKKVEALVQMSPPANVGELQSLLGMTNYLARFVPGYSTITAPLRKLTVQSQEFRWGIEQQSAFDKLKCILSGEPVMSFFDVKKETELIVDASPVGLGAMLVQYDKGEVNRKPQVVAYGSRALTAVEMRYKSQLEREALAVVWACEYFHIYVYGAPVKIITDHQPLVTLYGNPSAKLPLRLERWCMRLLPYKPIVEYRRGKDNPSDYMSRHPLESEKSSQECLVAEEYVDFIAAESIPKAMTATEVIDATSMDPTLSAVKDLLLTGRWYMMETKYAQDPSINFEALQSYCRVGNEITVTQDGLLMKGQKIVIPNKLQQQVVDLAHEGHQGLVKTKALIREKVWFPGIDNMVTRTIDECIACKSSYDPKPREPLVMTELPTKKWSSLAADFYGPLPSGDYLLVVMDEYSRFPEVDIIKSLSSNTVIPVLDKLFASRGTPDKFKTDNGTPFQSEEFKLFAENLGFHHQKITPYWPEANGMAERFMRNIGKVCKCAQAEGKPWRQELFRFLRNYRATPHSSTGVAPATILNGQPLKVKLPQVVKREDDEVLRKQDAAAKNRMKAHAEERRNIQYSKLTAGDRVLMKNVTQQGKMIPKFQPEPFEVIEKKGAMIIAQRGQEVKARNSSHFRKIHTQVNPLDVPNDIDPVDFSAPDTLPPSHTPNLVSPPNTPKPVSPHNSPQSNTSVRPKRVSKLPNRFQDFVVKMPNIGK